MIEIITYIASQIVDIETNGNPHIANAIYAVYANVLHAVGICNVIYNYTAESSRGGINGNPNCEKCDQK